MSRLNDKIMEHPQIFHSMRCEMVRVWDCEDKLNLTFPEEYAQYLCKYGAIGFGSVEWTGMNVETELNVVRATLSAREAAPSFPADCFVLRLSSAPDGMMVLCDEQERIYTWDPAGEKKLICEGLADTLR